MDIPRQKNTNFMTENYKLGNVFGNINTCVANPFEMSEFFKHIFLN